MALLEWGRGICLSRGRGSPTIENSRPHLDLAEKELSALSPGSDIDWGDRGREMERHDDDRVKVYWGIAETW